MKKIGQITVVLWRTRKRRKIFEQENIFISEEKELLPMIICMIRPPLFLCKWSFAKWTVLQMTKIKGTEEHRLLQMTIWMIWPPPCSSVPLQIRDLHCLLGLVSKNFKAFMSFIQINKHFILRQFLADSKTAGN